ncbi:hypothetical protein C8T65DRAFT_748851 [Cerioporus squamosus]|nr:hypothetical protein C8T65DRAFT_748851 [Cerioporus squamosus]
MSHVDDATAVASSSPYLQFRNITVVTCGTRPHETPVVFRATAAFLIQCHSSRWLLVEFSQADFAHTGGLPFPTAPLPGGMRVLIFKLPAAFDFEYFLEDSACLWRAVGEHARLFSLVFVYQGDYHRLQAAMSTSPRRAVHTCTVALSSRASSALREMLKQAGVDRMPEEEEDGKINS